MSEPRYPDVTVQLTGEDGNVFAVVGQVRRALQLAHGTAVAGAFTDEAFDCHSYDEVLQLCMRWVDVE